MLAGDRQESIHSITFPGAGEGTSRPPLFRSPSTGEMIVEDLGRQMQMGTCGSLLHPPTSC